MHSVVESDVVLPNRRLRSRKQTHREVLCHLGKVAVTAHSGVQEHN